MANYTTMFSCMLPVGAANVEAALALYQQMGAEWNEAGDEVGFEAERDCAGGEQLWLYSDDGEGDVEQVISYALRCAEAFDLRGTWGFCWSLGCDHPRLDGFGGGAQLLDLGRRKSLSWIDLDHWLTERTGDDEPCIVAAETLLKPVAATEGWTEATQVSVLLGFIDKLIDAEPSIADRLRADLAEVAASTGERDCAECGAPFIIADGGTSHHVGTGPDGIDYARDRDHTAIAEPPPGSVTAEEPSS